MGVGEAESGCGPGQIGADREVDASHRDHQLLTHRQHHQDRGRDQQVGQIRDGEEVRRRDEEDDEDDDQADRSGVPSRRPDRHAPAPSRCLGGRCLSRNRHHFPPVIGLSIGLERLRERRHCLVDVRLVDELDRRDDAGGNGLLGRQVRTRLNGHLSFGVRVLADRARERSVLDRLQRRGDAVDGDDGDLTGLARVLDRLRGAEAHGVVRREDAGDGRVRPKQITGDGERLVLVVVGGLRGDDLKLALRLLGEPVQPVDPVLLTGNALQHGHVAVAAHGLHQGLPGLLARRQIVRADERGVGDTRGLRRVRIDLRCRGSGSGCSSWRPAPSGVMTLVALTGTTPKQS